MAHQEISKQLKLADAGTRGIVWFAGSVVFLLAVAGCTIIRVGGSWVQECDPSWRGKGSERVYSSFNLHRGRWWNYYCRGRCFLDLGLYEDAQRDFSRAIERRGRDKWDARMYGMRFIDYFPHRERGIALYFLSEDAESPGRRQELLCQAIKELRISNDQQPSSRASFHFNQAQKAYWAGSDVTPPTIAIDGDIDNVIYANRSPVPIRVRATDYESGVAEIRITRADRGPVIRSVFELSKSETVEPIEVPLRPFDQESVLLVTGIDVVGTESKPQTVRIVVDRIPPSASISLDGYVELQDGRISASIIAEDNRALDRIQVGEANDVYDCQGRSHYSETIRGIPVRDELTIRIFDKAGNAVISSVRLGGVWGASPQRAHDQRLLQYAALSVDRGTASGWEPIVSSWHPTEAYSYLAWAAPAVRLRPQSQVSLNPMVGQPMLSGSRIRGTHFEFPPHVRVLGQAKETSQDFFYVDGTLYDAEKITKITVDDNDVRGAIPRGETRVFSYRVDLTRVQVGETKSIPVRAFQGQNRDERCIEEMIIKVRKTPDYSQDPNARYGIVLAPFTLGSRTCGSVIDDPIGGEAHAKAVVALGLLQAGGQGRFTVRDANQVAPKADGVDTGSLLRHLRRQDGSVGDTVSTDIVICGELTKYCQKDGDRFEIKLRAIDVLANTCIRFPDASGKDTRVLADVYGMTDDFQWYINLLADKVGRRIPRVCAHVVDTNGTQGPVATIDCGRGAGLFNRMKLRVYEGSAGPRNQDIGRPICPAEVQKVEMSKSVIKLLPNAPRQRSPDIRTKDVAITK